MIPIIIAIIAAINPSSTAEAHKGNVANLVVEEEVVETGDLSRQWSSTYYLLNTMVSLIRLEFY